MNQELSGPDRSINWIDTWKKMEEVYKKNPEKVKAIGTFSSFAHPHSVVLTKLQACRTSLFLSLRSSSRLPPSPPQLTRSSVIRAFIHYLHRDEEI